MYHFDTNWEHSPHVNFHIFYDAFSTLTYVSKHENENQRTLQQYGHAEMNGMDDD